jgi:hypothetical protein
MTREELAHILRAAAKIADDPGILVIGSQSILGSYPEELLPEPVWLSMEADIAFLNDPDAHKADLVDGAIGELSSFHEMYTYYAQGVEVSTALLPDGWRDRVIPFVPASAEPATALCLDPHDLVVSKLAAMREKDRIFATELVGAGLVNLETLQDRTEMLSSATALQRRAVATWLASLAERAKPQP